MNTRVVTYSIVLILLALTPFLVSAQASDTFEIEQTILFEESPGSGSSGGRVRLRISDVEVLPETQKAVISWSTNRPTQTRLMWGLTTKYGIGTLSASSRTVDHLANIQGLQPGTYYYFQIVVEDSFGRTRKYEGKFETNVLPDMTPPASPISFEAVPGNNVINLSWVNPLDVDLEAIRIIRSDKFFPDTPFAGKLIFDGLDIGVTDTEVVSGVTYYYAAFARYTSGNYAAPAIATARLGEATVEEPFKEFPEAPSIPDGIEKLELLDFDFIQDGKHISYIGTRIPVDGDKELMVSIDYDKLPEVLKTIGITLHDPGQVSKTFSFLLRINEDKTLYTATLAPLGRSGVYSLIATVLDLQNQKLKTFEGELFVLEKGVVTEEKTPLAQKLVWWFIGLLILLILLLIIVWFVRLRRKEDPITSGDARASEKKTHV